MKFFQVKSVDETLRLIHENIQLTMETEKKSIYNALHYVLAEDVKAKENVPCFPRSSVDGYAVKAKDTFGSSENMPGFLTVVGEVKMGQEPTKSLSTGEVMYVPTGGMIPKGSDAVIMIEHCEDLSGLLNIYRQVAPGENVISIGEDLKEGEVFVKKGTKLRPQELGALASQGIIEVNVYRKPRVGYLSSGDEIVPMETTTLKLGQIRDMNGLTIGALVQQWGFDYIYGGIVEDDRAELEKRARDLLGKSDCLIISGGSSVGTKDYSVEVIDSLGSPGVFVHGISIKPGKPTILAVADGKPIIGLPGHPASAMIIFERFGWAILEKLQGIDVSKRIESSCEAIVTKNLPSSPGRTDYVRVKLYEENGVNYAEPVFGKSGLISTLVKSDGLIEIPAKSEGIQKGEKISILLFQ